MNHFAGQGTHPATIEQLGKRVLLSVTLDGKTLKIVGTESADHIVVAADKRFINVVDVDVNDELSFFSLSAFSQIDIRAGGGNDRIIIDSTLDPLQYRSSIDTGAGNDRVTTAMGRDTIVGGDGNDRIRSGKGNDCIDGGEGNDRLFAERGHDTIAGGDGNDLIDGGFGNDHISDTGGRDTVNAGSGNDAGTFSDDGDIHGGTGNDDLSSSGGAYLYGEAGDDTLSGKVVWGGDGNDTVNGTDRSDRLHGDDGNDEIHGKDGDDAIFGGAGTDSLFGDNGGDALIGGSDNDTIHGGAGDDTLYADDGHDDTNHLNDGKDVAFGDDGSDWFEPTNAWKSIDAAPRKDKIHQNDLLQDPSGGKVAGYASMGLTSNSVVVRYTLNDDASLDGRVNGLDFNAIATNFGSSRGWTSGDFNYDGAVNAVDFNSLAYNFNQQQQPAAKYKSLGHAGFLVSGINGSSGLSPGPLNEAQRRSVHPAFIQLPADWKLGAMTADQNKIIWYRVTRGSGDDVGEGYQFLAVKRGSILIQSASSPAKKLKHWGWNTTLLSIPTDSTIRIAGSGSVYHAASGFAELATPSPDRGRGIRITEGAIWLPRDGAVFAGA
jgi:Ca2+-binding RTX toxin-like protein